MPMNHRLMRPVASTAAFTPSSLSGLVMWLDASDATTLFQSSNGTTPAASNDDPVAYWGDKSGLGNHVTQPTPTSCPLLATNATNGLNALSFDGADDTLISGFSVPLNTPKALTVFLAMKRRASSAAIFSARTNGGPDYLTGCVFNTGDYSTNQHALTWGSGATEGGAEALGDLRDLGSDTQTWGIAAFFISAADNTCGIRLRGSAVTAASVYELSPSGFLSVGLGSHAIYIASRAYGSELDPLAWADCQIGEVIVCNAKLSLATTLAVESYLSDKWGFGS